MSITLKEKQAWIISCINHTSYTEETGEINLNDVSTVEEKLQFIADRLISEAYYPYNVQRFHGNDQKIIADHLQGLHSWLHIPFTNWDILQLAIAWGYDVSTEKKEDAFCERYWGAIAMIILSLFRKYKIKLEVVK